MSQTPLRRVQRAIGVTAESLAAAKWANAAERAAIRIACPGLRLTAAGVVLTETPIGARRPQVQA
jgi:hypothetical protein